MRTPLAALAILTLFASVAAKAGTVYTSETTWQTAVKSSQDVSFNIGLPPGGLLYESTFTSNGLTLSAPTLLFDDIYVVNGVTINSSLTATFTFAEPVFAFAFNSYVYEGTPLLLTLSNGDTYTTAQTSQQFFYGVVSDTPFTSATLQETTSDNYLWNLNDASYAPVAEPESLALLGAGLIGTLSLRRRGRPDHSQ
jgi:hypothetical protein